MISEVLKSPTVQIEQSSEQEPPQAPDPTALSPPRPCAVPARLKVGEVINVTLVGGPVVVVGARPVGHPVVLSPENWRTLQQWKLDKLSTATGRVVSYDKGIQQPTARFLCGIAYVRSKGVAYKNGSPLDLRPSNLIVMPWSRIVKERERRRTARRQTDG